MIRHHKLAVLENADLEHRVLPHRLDRLFLPVWHVKIKATTEDATPYDVIDRFVERGIAEAGLRTRQELGEFLGLDESLVHRTVRFLTQIGHLRVSGDSLTLTDLGLKSVRKGERYTYTREDRRVLYFDAFGSRPLTRSYYDSRAVRFLTETEASKAALQASNPFTPLGIRRSFRREALDDLANQQDRRRFNLPRGLHNPTWLDETPMYLPAYVVRGIDQSDQVRYLAYTQAIDKPDREPYLTKLCQTARDLTELVDWQEAERRRQFDQPKLQKKLAKLTSYAPAINLDNGLARVSYPAAAFADTQDADKLLRRVGTFIPYAEAMVHIWCLDQEVRRRALVTKAAKFLHGSTQSDVAQDRLEKTARSLKLGDIDLTTLHQLARAQGETTLAGILSKML